MNAGTSFLYSLNGDGFGDVACEVQNNAGVLGWYIYGFKDFTATTATNIKIFGKVVAPDVSNTIKVLTFST